MTVSAQCKQSVTTTQHNDRTVSGQFQDYIRSVQRVGVGQDNGEFGRQWTKTQTPVTTQYLREQNCAVPDQNQNVHFNMGPPFFGELCFAKKIVCLPLMFIHVPN